jgi:hypothetical protein
MRCVLSVLSKSSGVLFMCMLAFNGTAHGAFVDLSTWVVENYDSLDGPANWTISGPGNTTATQWLNSDPSILRSNDTIDVAGMHIEGTFRVNDHADDDMIGFVFAFQNRGQMYLFDWKRALQGNADVGMRIKLIDTGGLVDPTLDDFITSAGTSVTSILRENSIPWLASTDYSFALDFGGDVFAVEIRQGDTTLQNWLVHDGTFTSGDFGLYNDSQPNTVYGNITTTIPAPTPIVLVGIGAGVTSLLRRRRGL